MQENIKLKEKFVETYAEDMAQVIEEDKSGLIKKIIQEEEKHELEKKNLSPESLRNKLFMLFGLLFVVISGAIVFYLIVTSEPPIVPVEEQPTPLIFHEGQKTIEVFSLDRDKIIGKIADSVAKTTLKKGAIEGFYITNNKRKVGLREFLNLIESSFVLARAGSGSALLVSDEFLMGVANINSKDFFVLLKVREVADIFEQLRAWEKKMYLDLEGLFGYTLSPETKYLLTKNFDDGIIQNKNARILRRTDGTIALLYVFADDNSVVITNTEQTAREIMLRLSASRVGK